MNKSEVFDGLLRDIASVIGSRGLPSGFENVHDYVDEVVEFVRDYADDFVEACEYLLDTGKNILDPNRFEIGYRLVDRIKSEMELEKGKESK